MKKLCCAIIIGIACVISTTRMDAQQQSYADVLVVVNINSAISDSIGSYFAASRGIPSINIAAINVPVAEEIDGLQFEDLRSQVEKVLTNRNLTETINYIVTTKGVPLKVKRGNLVMCSSVESELTLILGNYAQCIGQSGGIVSPYYGQVENFSRAKFGIYLVTRLDGYTFNDVKGIIDRASTIPTSIPSYGKFVMDEDPSWTPLAGFLNSNMKLAATKLQSRNLNTVLDTSTVFLTHQADALGYTSWGSNDHCQSLYATHAIPSNTYLPGAIAETYVSTSARSFSVPQQYGQSLIADLIAEGVTGVKGYVYEPYSGAMAAVNILFPMYVDGYTLAESYYSSSYYLSWMDVVVGDPKYRLINKRLPPTPLPVELTSFTSTARGKSVELSWSTASEVNNYGFEIQRKPLPNPLLTAEGIKGWGRVGYVEGAGTTNIPKNYSYADLNLQCGKYEYRLKQIDRDGQFKYSQSVEATINVATVFALEQNYPNPFNPSTTIRYNLPNRSTVRLEVTNTLGQQVAVLENGEREAGYHEVEWRANVASGFYLFRIDAVSTTDPNNRFVQVKKMLLLR